MANNSDVKKYLDKEGLKHFAKVLANYPDNTILAAVIDAISSMITETSDSDRQYTINSILSNYGNFGEIFVGDLGEMDLPSGCKVLIDAEDDEMEWLMNEIRNYVDDTLFPKHTLVIDVNTYDGSPITQDVYVSIFNTDTDELYAKIKYENKLIKLRMPADFNYNIMVDDLPGYFINSSKSGTLNKDTELTFNYQIHTTFGVTWDKTSTTKLSRYGSATLFEDPAPYVAGATEYGSPFDRCEPWCNISIVEDANAGTLVAIPKYWFRWTDTDGMLRLEIANYAAEGFAVSPAHRDRGDGKGERDVVYIGRYHCSIDNFKSETGVKPKASMTIDNFRTNIHNLGSNVYQNDFAMFWTIRMLYLVEYADWNSQKVIGYGCGNESSDVMGYTDSMPYHTGTTQSSRTTFGLGTQYRYIEGLWDNVWDWCDGIYFSSANVYAIMNPNNFSDTANGTLVGTRPTSSGYINSLGISTIDGFDWFLYPATTGGSSSTYIPDNCSYNSSGVVLHIGGNYGKNMNYGMFYLNGNYGTLSLSGGIGSRLMVLP